MLTGRILDDGVIQLRCLSSEEVGHKYLGWLSDLEVNRYLEIRHSPPASVAELAQFVDFINQSADSILFGIFLLDGIHIGNVKLGPIDSSNRRTDVGLLIGDKGQWGRGYATRAIRLVSDFAFQHLDLVRLTAGCYDPNQGSFHAFMKAGYQHEGTLANYWQCEGQSVGEIMMGLSFGHGGVKSRSINFGRITSLVFVGGGYSLLKTIQSARLKSFVVGAILAPRHATEVIASGKTLMEELQSQKIPACIAETASDVDPQCLGEGFASSLALCFGPAWIFPDEVLMRFHHGMLNFNGIPIPHYLGGAHYTWQILTGHRGAGCHIQQISSDVDRGDLLLSKTFDLPDDTTTPEDYFRENEKFAVRFMEGFLDELKAGHDFQARPFADVDNHRLYFPRLITTENGWIDWSWSANQILSFCQAFGPPYRGASTKLNGRRIYLKQVAFIVESSAPDFHPFCSGLIVRCLDNSFFVAVSGGLLQVDEYEFDDQESEVVRIREGDRLFTDAATLEHARIYRPQISANGNLTDKV